MVIHQTLEVATLFSHTVNTTRIPGAGPVEFGISLSQIVYPTYTVPWRPNVAILAPVDDPFAAVIASSLMHHPLNGPMLLMPRDHVPDAVAAELLRLRLPGLGDGFAIHVVMVGAFAPEAIDDVRHLGYTPVFLADDDPTRLAVAVARYRHQVAKDARQRLLDLCVVLTDGGYPAPALAALAAHTGVPLLPAGTNQLAAEVTAFVRELGAPRLHLIAPDGADLRRLVSELKAITSGLVGRVGGADGVETAINLARYQSTTGVFGWGRSRPGGHAFTFAPAARWDYAVLGGLLGHLGKHAPVLVVPQGPNLPESLRTYLASVKPKPAHIPGPPFMHAFVLGDVDQGISMEMQFAIEAALMPEGM